jgi:hypothetical protein
MTTTIDIDQLRRAAEMLRTPAASWHREEMAAVLELAVMRGERRVRKAKPSRNVELFLKAKFVNSAPGNGRGARFARPDDVNVYMECNGQRIYTNDPAGAKAAREYLKALREQVAA